MSLFSDRNLTAEARGYWAVEMRLADGAGRGRRYLCHAENDRAACNIAGRLMGSAVDMRGFDSFWIDERLLEQRRSSLPDIGRHQNVSGRREWARLIDAHEASDAAYPLRQ